MYDEWFVEHDCSAPKNTCQSCGFCELCGHDEFCLLALDERGME